MHGDVVSWPSPTETKFNGMQNLGTLCFVNAVRANNLQTVGVCESADETKGMMHSHSADFDTTVAQTEFEHKPQHLSLCSRVVNGNTWPCGSFCSSKYSWNSLWLRMCFLWSEPSTSTHTSFSTPGSNSEIGTLNLLAV